MKDSREVILLLYDKDNSLKPSDLVRITDSPQQHGDKRAKSYYLGGGGKQKKQMDRQSYNLTHTMINPDKRPKSKSKLKTKSFSQFNNNVTIQHNGINDKMNKSFK